MSLIITRRIGESIVLRDGEKEIVVLVKDVQGRQVRLAIDAPQEVKISREPT